MNKKLRKKLEYHYKKFDYSQIYPDPLIFPHRYKNKLDIEISAFVSSIFAYGKVTQIINSLEKLHTLFGDSPVQFISKFNRKENSKYLKNFKHRFYTSEDTLILFEIIKRILIENGSIKKLFLNNYSNKTENIKEALSKFSFNINEIAKRYGNASRGIKFMFPNPNNGSACKRMNLFLRWMVRKDELDFGLWKEISTSQLIIPVDTHVAKISRNIGLTKLKNVSWKMAEDITNNLKKFDSKDPVKYDFAICHIGIRNQQF